MAASQRPAGLAFECRDQGLLKAEPIAISRPYPVRIGLVDTKARPKDLLGPAGILPNETLGAVERSQEEGGAAPVPSGKLNPFAGFAELPTFSEAASFLVMEALERAGGNQTLAGRLLGISQPALNKRLKMMRGQQA